MSGDLRSNIIINPIVYAFYVKEKNLDLLRELLKRSINPWFYHAAENPKGFLVLVAMTKEDRFLLEGNLASNDLILRPAYTESNLIYELISKDET